MAGKVKYQGQWGKDYKRHLHEAISQARIEYVRAAGRKYAIEQHVKLRPESRFSLDRDIALVHLVALLEEYLINFGAGDIDVDKALDVLSAEKSGENPTSEHEDCVDRNGAQ